MMEGEGSSLPENLTMTNVKSIIYVSIYTSICQHVSSHWPMLQIHKLGLHLVSYKNFWVYLHAVFSWLVTCEQIIVLLRLVDF